MGKNILNACTIYSICLFESHVTILPNWSTTKFVNDIVFTKYLHWTECIIKNFTIANMFVMKEFWASYG